MNARGPWSIFFGLATLGWLLEAGVGCGDDPCASATENGCTGGGGSGGVCTLVPEPKAPKESDEFEDDDSHWILKDPNAECASVPSWTGRRLFDGQFFDPETGYEAVIGGTIASYCAYTWTGMGKPDVALLPSLPKARDRRAITPQSPTVEDWAHDTFLAGISLPQGAPELKEKDPHVRVIVADTEQDSVGAGGAGAVGNNRHGELMADLVRQVACPAAAACAVDIETRLALPRVRNVAQNTEEVVTSRGDYGRLTDLVGAVDRALSHWRSGLDGEEPFPATLALNLSLAFDEQVPLPADDGSPKDDFSADAVVLDTLKAFSCHGGVTFAAAGNHGGKGSTGLMYPAAWQALDAPSDQECALLLDGPDLPGSPYKFFATLEMNYLAKLGEKAVFRRPYFSLDSKSFVPGKLLHGIGAFDQGGVPIKKTREEACPRYGALGLGWSVPGKSSFLLTGTSVPTAVVSAFFAAAMAQDSFVDLQQQNIQEPYIKVHPDTVLDRLGAKSPPSPFQAGGPCGAPWTCGDIPWIGSPSEVPLTSNHALGFPWEDYQVNPSLAAWNGEDNGCTRLALCEQQAASAISVIFPQPNDIPCTRGCVMNLTRLSFAINPAMDLTYAKLFIESSNGTRQIIDVTTNEQPALIAGTSYEIPLDRAITILGDDRISISALDASGNKVLNEQVLLAK